MKTLRQRITVSKHIRIFRINYRIVCSQPLPYPKSVFLIITTEICERFNYFGMRAILSLYLRDILLFGEHSATVIYHTFIMIAYFFPIIGAIISDNYLGKFKTIFYISLIYACGNIILAAASAKPFGLAQIPFSLLGLFLIAFGTGGIKPCVAPFGGDQFVLPQQQAHLEKFFSMLYFSVNSGSLLSTLVTPILRGEVHCCGENSCYPLAFSLPAVLMVIAIVIFLSGKRLYKIVQPTENVVIQFVKCIAYAIKEKCKSKDKVDHWLDRSTQKYGLPLVDDVKGTLNIFILFVPLPIFWALYEQQGSGWTFQASHMNGQLGSLTILPDQMQVINAILILIFIPLFTYGVYPALAKCNLLKKPLQRMVCGGLLTALSFAISATISFAIESTLPVIPAEGSCQLRIYNPLKCNAILTAAPYIVEEEIKSMGYTKLDVVDVSGEKVVDFNITGCDDVINYQQESNITITEKKTLLFYMLPDQFLRIEDDIQKDEKGLPKIRTLVNSPVEGYNLSYWKAKKKVLEIPSSNYSFFTVPPGTYRLEGFEKEFDFYLGGVYTVLVSLDESNESRTVEYYEVTEPNSVHMLCLIPQYFTITAGEVMFVITGLEFSYSQAPTSMKAVVQAVYYLTSAMGNLIIVIIESAEIFERQVKLS
ncbi:hypothetical protein GEV33_009990 [Tenebrio molitor]|uniref:Oligopeptide transporter 1 n=1 Tax=Tenebrio molitor TaxID=7067 RepID=A0A8J6H6H0_TENMO|nr:hypothetical protein GEV33_009990 [Tenebrio molitor]